MADDQYRQAVDELLSLSTEALFCLTWQLQKQGAKMGLVFALIARLEALARQIARIDKSLCDRLLDRAFALRADAYDAIGDDAKVIEVSRDGMGVALPTEASFYNHAGYAARSLFKLGQIGEGFQVLAAALRAAMENKMERHEARGIIRRASLAESFDDINVEFGDAVREFATSHLGWNSQTFNDQWALDPKAVLERLVGSLP